MFKKFFSRIDEDDEDEFDAIDPVLEQRRKEKFSAPLIYNDEPVQKKVEEKRPEPVVQQPTMTTTSRRKRAQQADTYRMTEIISPMTGVAETKKPEVKVARPKVRRVKTESNDLIPIISPFYGPADAIEEAKPKKKKEVKKETVKKEPTVEDNLRNIASIVDEEKDQLKIIEERTGEFKLDLLKDDEDSLIDEIDDSMSLDELMSLYEKKFKD